MQRREIEKKECKFSPSIIGHDYKNSGLPFTPNNKIRGCKDFDKNDYDLRDFQVHE